MHIILLDQTSKLMCLGVCLSSLGMLIQPYHSEVLEDEFSLLIRSCFSGERDCEHRSGEPENVGYPSFPFIPVSKLQSLLGTV